MGNLSSGKNAPDARIRIAFILWTLSGMGGSEKVVYDLARKLNPIVYNVVIVSFSDGPVRKLYEEFGATVYAVPKGPGFDLSLVSALRRILLEEEIDVVNAHHFGPLLYSHLSTIGLKAKLVYTEHSKWQLEQLPLFLKLLNRLMLSRTQAVVAISKQIEQYYLHRLLIKKKCVHFIANGIDAPFFRGRDGRYLRQSLGIGEREKVVGVIANLRPEKNHKLLISAFSEVVRSMEDIRLILVGLDCMDGELQKIAAQSHASDKILFLGSRQDVPELLGIFDVFCLPSTHEGLPLTVLEAMAAGVPVVGSDVMGINEVVTHDVNGLLFPSNDERALADVLLRLLRDKDLQSRLARAGEAFVTEHFSLDEKVDAYDKLFHYVYQLA
jgi:glycosyltransferase involved in cell wall biosynthesis